MGSGQSSVKGIRIEQDDTAQDQKASVKKKNQNVKNNNSKDKGNDVLPKTSRSTSNTDNKDAEAEIASLTKQLCESESQRLDLEDRVQALEERIEYLNTQNLMTETQPCDETLHVKDQYISKLEKEKDDLEKESNKMRQKLRRKIKQLNSQMAEFKQESHFEMMELRDEIQKLTEENKSLRDSSQEVQQKQSSPTENAPILPGGEKMKLILELSEQVTEQGDKISKLEKKIQDKDHTIEELRVRLKNNTEYLKAVDQSGLSDRGERNNSARLEKSKDSPSRRHWGSSSPHSGHKTNLNMPRKYKEKEEESMDSLFAPQSNCIDDDDDDFEHSASMKKLSVLLHGTKSDDNKARESLEALNSDRHDSDTSNHLYQIVEEAPESSNGRDSGLGSAGKRGNENITSDGQQDLYTKWKESSALSFESEVSDSDSITDSRNQGKVSSAPPKLQNQGNVRIKKKSNSLKKRVSDKKDRPPRPGMAFVNSNQNGAIVTDDRLTGLYKLNTALSTVNVS